jgi:hypothetical protein
LVFSIRKDTTFNAKLEQNLVDKFTHNRRNEDDPVHVSDLTSGCIRKSWYRRKFPEQDTVDTTTALHFLRGIASQYALTQLLNLERTEVPITSSDSEIVGHVDAMLREGSKDCVVEMKSTNSMSHYDIDDDTFKNYLRQIFYYLILTDLEKAYLIIKYEQHEMRFFKKDKEGNSHYIRERDHKPASIETWEIILTRDSIEHQKLKSEMMEAKSIFLESLQKSDVSMLPRLTGTPRFIKCRTCQFYQKCFQEDTQSTDAVNFGSKVSVLDQLVADVSAEV